MQKQTEVNNTSYAKKAEAVDQSQPVVNESMKRLSALSGSEMADANTQREALSNSYQINLVWNN